jgi:mono/diheme cytochrome c family protein
MKKVFRILGCLLAAVLVLAGGAVTYLYARKPAMAPAANVKIERTPERLARGEYLYRLADCDGCHSDRDYGRFGGPVNAGGIAAGQVFPREAGLPGSVTAPNLTPDVETGIGSWSDGEKVRAIREGVDRDGRTLFPMMPYGAFRKMSDEDVYSLVAYLGTLPAVKRAHPQTQLDFPVGLMIKSAPKPAGSVPNPDLSEKVKKGEYLVNIAGCQGCHTPSLAGGEKFAGPGTAVFSANISPDPSTGIGRWSEQDFVNKFAQYRDYAEHGSPKVGPESFTIMPWLNFCQLPEDDLRAMYAYLRTLPPVSKAVETHPGFDPKVKQMVVSGDRK